MTLLINNQAVRYQSDHNGGYAVQNVRSKANRLSRGVLTVLRKINSRANSNRQAQDTSN